MFWTHPIWTKWPLMAATDKERNYFSFKTKMEMHLVYKQVSEQI